MGRPLVVVAWKVSSCQDDGATQSNLRIRYLLSKCQQPLCRDEKDDPQIHMGSQGLQKAKTVLKNKNLEDSHFLVSKLTAKLQYSRQCGADIGTDFWTNETEQRVQK